MFRNLLSFWKGKDFIAKVFEDFKSMLDDTEFMFQAVCKHLLENTQEPELKQRIYDIDKQVNVLQRDIRKRIVEHLTLQPTVDTTACLVLMSVVKDAERLGDYCKNLFEVSELTSEPINRELYHDYFDGLNSDIAQLFENTKKAFIDADESTARQTWEIERRIAKGCDAIVQRAAQSNLSVNEAVCFTLIARYYKRIVAHLVNIATAVIVPLSDLDYFDEREER
ncbi:phosphate uptake regulator PhoU [Planctomycetota bacterium]